MRDLFQRLLGASGPEAALTQADALLATGRYRAAIDLLTAENRRRADALIETRLVALRHEGFHVEPIAAPADHWPPSLSDPFPGRPGVPEIDASALSGECIGATIMHHGAVIVRGLVTVERAAVLAADIDQALRAYDAFVDGRASTDDARWFTPFPARAEYEYSEVIRRWGRQSGGQLLLADSPRALFDIIETFTDIGIGRHLADWFGEWPALSFKKSTLRRCPPDSETEWHQDGAFLGPETRTVNLWLACSPCGIDAPSLDVVGRRLDLLETGTGTAAFKWSVAREVGERVGGDDIVRPIFAPGDAILFDHLNLHRTGVGPGMTRPRYAVESWFFAPSTYPMEQVPILF